MAWFWLCLFIASATAPIIISPLSSTWTKLLFLKHWLGSPLQDSLQMHLPSWYYFWSPYQMCYLLLLIPQCPCWTFFYGLIMSCIKVKHLSVLSPTIHQQAPRGPRSDHLPLGIPHITKHGSLHDHLSTNIHKMEYFLSASTRNITP